MTERQSPQHATPGWVTPQKTCAHRATCITYKQLSGNQGESVLHSNCDCLYNLMEHSYESSKFANFLRLVFSVYFLGLQSVTCYKTVLVLKLFCFVFFQTEFLCVSQVVLALYL